MNAKEIFENNPLMAISFMISYQVNEVVTFGNETIELIDKSFISSKEIDGKTSALAYRNIWLWTLASYEISRTLDQRKEIFNEPFRTEIGELKKAISKLRMPFAKHEIPGKKGSFTKTEMAIKGTLDKEIDYLFIVKNHRINFKSLFIRFRTFFDKLTINDLNLELE